MGKVLGNKRKCYVGSGHSWLGGEQSNNINLNGNLVETSDKSTAWQTFIQGIKGATANVTVHADDSDAQQLTLLNSLVQGATVSVFIGEMVGEGNSAVLNGYAFTAHVASVDETNDNGSVSTRTLSLTAEGAVTVTPAPSA